MKFTHKVTFTKLAPMPPKGDIKPTEGYHNATSLEEAESIKSEWEKQEGVSNVRIEEV